MPKSGSPDQFWSPRMHDPPLPTVVLTGIHFGSHKWSCFSILTAKKLSRHIQAMYMGEINRKDIATHAGQLQDNRQDK